MSPSSRITHWNGRNEALSHIVLDRRSTRSLDVIGRSIQPEADIAGRHLEHPFNLV